MGQLEDDIARVAALRGRDPASVASPDQRAWRSATSALNNPNSLRVLFVGDPGGVAREMALMDTLPRLSREWIWSAPLYVNVLTYAALLEQCDFRERPVLEACDRAMVAAVRAATRRHYGPTHPDLGDHHA